MGNKFMMDGGGRQYVQLSGRFNLFDFSIFSNAAGKNTRGKPGKAKTIFFTFSHFSRIFGQARTAPSIPNIANIENTPIPLVLKYSSTEYYIVPSVSCIDVKYQFIQKLPIYQYCPVHRARIARYSKYEQYL